MLPLECRPWLRICAYEIGDVLATLSSEVYGNSNYAANGSGLLDLTCLHPLALDEIDPTLRGEMDRGALKKTISVITLGLPAPQLWSWK